MRFYRPLFPASFVYPEAIFRVKSEKKALCLTFDDGPDDESTPGIIKILGSFEIKAIFFCSGEKAEKNPFLMKSIRENGHLVGNHGYRHINGFLTPASRYAENADAAALLTSGKIFRPPYGFITPLQYRILKKTYTIYFWDLMTYDFRRNCGLKKLPEILAGKTRPGSVIVFHDRNDSVVLEVLGEFITICLKASYHFIIPALSTG